LSKSASRSWVVQMHDDYHKVTDEVDKIDFTKMKRVAQYAFLLADKVANQKNRIVVDNPVNKIQIHIYNRRDCSFSKCWGSSFCFIIPYEIIGPLF